MRILIILFENELISQQLKMYLYFIRILESK